MKTNEAIKIFGNVKALAKALGISDKAVYKWKGTVPRLRSYQIRDIQAAGFLLADSKMESIPETSSTKE